MLTKKKILKSSWLSLLRGKSDHVLIPALSEQYKVVIGRMSFGLLRNILFGF